MKLKYDDSFIIFATRNIFVQQIILVYANYTSGFFFLLRYLDRVIRSIETASISKNFLLVIDIICESFLDIFYTLRSDAGLICKLLLNIFEEAIGEETVKLKCYEEKYLIAPE